MADEPDSLVLIYPRQLDAKVDGLIHDMPDVKVRLTNLEEGQSVLSRRLDRLEMRVERIERRDDLADMPH